MKELLEMNVSSRIMRKHLIKAGYFTEDFAPPDQVFYSKTSNLREKPNLNSETIGLNKFEDLIEQ